MSPDEMVRHAAQHHIRTVRPNAAQFIAAAAAAICVRERQRATAAQLLAGDAARFEALLAEMDACDARLAELLPDTPTQVLTSIPGVGVLTASYYGAALGVHRFTKADAAYRHSGLAPTAYESAGRRSGNVHISKVGSVELRQAIIAVGTAITLHHPDFAANKRRLTASGKKPIVVTIAVAHRAPVGVRHPAVPEALRANPMGAIRRSPWSRPVAAASEATRTT
jgi:hypothetical protein